jgi:hypothetical protein
VRDTEGAATLVLSSTQTLEIGHQPWSSSTNTSWTGKKGRYSFNSSTASLQLPKEQHVLATEQ